MFRCSKLVSLPKNLQISVRSILQHELRPLLNFKILPNNRFGSNMLTSTLVRNCSSMFSHGNTDLKIDQDSSCLDLVLFEKVSGEMLENFADVFDTLLEELYLPEFDVTLANGVLTLQLSQHGTYVINKQTPNRQLWLSSPTSGPKRYDYVDGKWIYKHDSHRLQDLLAKEFSQILGKPVTL